MKKGFIPVMLSVLLAGGALVGCGQDDPGQQQEVNYTVTITNKNALETGEWHVRNKTKPSLTLGVEPRANANDLVAQGKITVSSSDTSVATVDGRNITPVAPGKVTITATCGESHDSVELTILPWLDPITNKPERLMEAAVGTYRLGSENYAFSTEGIYYFKGVNEFTNSYYWTAIQEFKKSPKVTVEEIAGVENDYKWALKVQDKYLGIKTSHNDKGDHANQATYDDTTDVKTHWKWNADAQTFMTYVEKPAEWTSKQSSDYYLGMQGGTNVSYTLFEAGTLEGNDETLETGYFPAHLYKLPNELEVSQDSILLIFDVHESEKIEISMPQGEMSYTKKSGDDCVTIGSDGTLTAAAVGECVITVSDTKTSIDIPVKVRDAVAGETADNPLTVDAALDIANALENKAYSTSKYYVSGVVDTIDDATLGTCWLKGTTSRLEVYKPVDNEGNAYSAENPVPFIKGSTLVAYGLLQKYNSTLELAEGSKVVSYDNPQVLTLTKESVTLCTESPDYTIGYASNNGDVTFTIKSGDAVTVSEAGVISVVKEGAAVITVADDETSIDFSVNVEGIINPDQAYAKYLAIEDPSSTAATYFEDGKQFFTKGVVTKVNSCSGRATFFMKTAGGIVDGVAAGKEIQIYNMNGFDNVNNLKDGDIVVGDTVVVSGAISAFKQTTCEIQYKSGTTDCYLVKNTRGTKIVTYAATNATIKVNDTSVSGAQTVNNGTKVEFTVDVEAGYEIDNVKINGSIVADDEGVYSFLVKGDVTVVVNTKVEGAITEQIAASIDLTSTASATGGTLTMNKYSAKTGYYQDGGSEVGVDCTTFQVLNSTEYWTTKPQSITFRAKLGGGSDKATLTYNVEVVLLSKTGEEIANTKKVVTTSLLKAGADYAVEMPVDIATSVAGFKMTHIKETSYNARFYSASLCYMPAAN